MAHYANLINLGDHRQDDRERAVQRVKDDSTD